MCFSPEASFTAGGVLLIAGGFAVAESKFTNKLPFAVIPILFAAQQISEGFVWLGLQHSQYEPWLRAATIFFLVFAQVVWPFWVPFSIWFLEKKPAPKKILAAISILGGLVSAYLLYCIFRFPVTASTDCLHIYYNLDFPASISTIVSICYLIAITVPPFVSKARKTSLLGVILLVSLLISELFYTKSLISVWCFFAATLSVVVVYVLYHARGKDVLKRVIS
jgi:hypothetical protein